MPETTMLATDLKAAETATTATANDIKAVLANRVGDVVIALIVLGAIWLGHAL